MNHWTLILLLVLLPVGALADNVYHIRPLSEKQLLKMYESVMLDACDQAEGEWHDWPTVAGAGHWGTGISGGNEGIRSISQMVLVSGALLKYADLPADKRLDLKTKAIGAIRYATATHKSGTQKCTDGKQWGGDWQSAMWTGTLAFGTWLMWDKLDDALRKDVERVVASETDRFLASPPPGGRWFDTKAEENGWTLICISAAANMFPSHPHASAWNEKAIEYIMNTLSTPADLRDETVVDGRPAKDWISSPNLHPDYTLENHGFFHPAYVECSTYFLTQAAMHYVYAGRSVPQAATHHINGTWGLLRSIMQPCGESAFPQGMDWELHGLPNINGLASFGTFMKDPFAAGKEQIVLQRLRTWQKWQNGDLAVPGSKLGFTRHSIVAEQTTYGYLAHKIFGPPQLVEWSQNVGQGVALPPQHSGVSRQPASIVQSHNSVGFILHRTDSKLFTFSWKNRIMGMLAPIADGYLDNPHFTVPVTNGFVGSMELKSGDAKLAVSQHASKKTPDGFEADCTLLTNGGQLRQEIRIGSMGERAVVYQDRITALADVTVARELGVPFGVENDRMSGGTRTVTCQDGSVIFDWQKPQPAVHLPGSWANIDGRLGVVTVTGSGITYAQAPGYNAQAVCADILYGSYSDEPGDFKAGDEVAHRVVLFFVETTPEQTAAVAKSVTIDGKVLRFRLPVGGECEISLL